MNENFYPILLDISDLKILVIGAGKVALRKIKNLSEFEADITIISPKIDDEIVSFSKNNMITIHEREYQMGDVSKHDMVFCATDNRELNEKIAEECQAKKILVNSADGREQSSFLVPATIKDGKVCVSVSSQGEAPFFVKKLKEQIKSNLPKYLSEKSDIASKFRENVLKDETFLGKDKKALYKIFHITNWDSRLEKYGLKKAKEYVAKIIEEYKKL